MTNANDVNGFDARSDVVFRQYKATQEIKDGFACSVRNDNLDSHLRRFVAMAIG
jgi:hypothetical protein